MRRRTTDHQDSSGGGLVEVELLDVDSWVQTPGGAVDEQGAGPGGSSAAAGPAPGRRRRIGVGAVIVTVALLGAVTANVAEAARERSRRATLAASSGLFDPLTEPLRPAWELAGFSAGGTKDVTLVNDGDAMRAVDAGGAVLWTRQTPSSQAGQEYCWAAGHAAVELEALREGVLLGPSGTAGEQGRGLLGCVTFGAFGNDPGQPQFGPVSIVVLDVASGAELHTLTVDGATVMAEPIGDEVVIAVATPEGHLRLTRWDPASGDRLSDVTSADRVFRAGTSEILELDRHGDHLVVTGEAPVAFSLVTGEELDPFDLPSPQWDLEVELPDGGTATWVHDGSGANSYGRGQVLNPDGTVRFDLPGPHFHAAVSDGSVPSVLVAGSPDLSTVVGLDAVTGEELWSSPASGAHAIARVDGVLVVQAYGSAIALDLRDGSTVWTTPTATSYYFDGISDGEVVVVLEAVGTGAELVARAIDDGSVRWRSALLDGGYGVMTTPGVNVIVSTEDSVIGLR